MKSKGKKIKKAIKDKTLTIEKKKLVEGMNPKISPQALDKIAKSPRIKSTSIEERIQKLKTKQKKLEKKSKLVTEEIKKLSG